MAEISNGVWFDLKTNRVVESQPQEGVQIVSPGSEMTPNLEAEVKRYREMEDGTVSTPETVTTASVEEPAAEAPAEPSASKSKK